MQRIYLLGVPVRIIFNFLIDLAVLWGFYHVTYCVDQPQFLLGQNVFFLVGIYVLDHEDLVLLKHLVQFPNITLYELIAVILSILYLLSWTAMRHLEHINLIP